MEQGKIVLEGRSRQQKSILIRSLQQNDAEALCRYLNPLSEERTFVRFQGEQFTLEEETAYHTDEFIQYVTAPLFDLVSFQTIPSKDEPLYFQSLILRAKKEMELTQEGEALSSSLAFEEQRMIFPRLDRVVECGSVSLEKRRS